MSASPESFTLTNTLLSAVRLQRHLGVRVIVSSQEPTIAPALLDLCSTTIIHRFSSPAWLRALRARIAINVGKRSDAEHEDGRLLGESSCDIFETIVSLSTGEALIFCPSAPIKGSMSDDFQAIVLGQCHVRVKIRARLSEDGGKSILAR